MLGSIVRQDGGDNVKGFCVIGGSACRFMHGVEDFDAACFGIHTSEALVMDPQQRLMLEVRTAGSYVFELCQI